MQDASLLLLGGKVAYKTLVNHHGPIEAILNTLLLIIVQLILVSVGDTDLVTVQCQLLELLLCELKIHKSLFRRYVHCSFKL